MENQIPQVSEPQMIQEKSFFKKYAYLIIFVIAALLIGVGYSLYAQKVSQKDVQAESSISDVGIAEEGLFFGNLNIAWKSTGVEMVDIYLYGINSNVNPGVIATSTVNSGTFYYEIEGASAMRDYDGPYKVVVTSSKDPSIKAESIPLKIGRPCSIDVCGDPQIVEQDNWVVHKNVNYGFEFSYPLELGTVTENIVNEHLEDNAVSVNFVSNSNGILRILGFALINSGYYKDYSTEILSACNGTPNTIKLNNSYAKRYDCEPYIINPKHVPDPTPIQTTVVLVEEPNHGPVIIRFDRSVDYKGKEESFDKFLTTFKLD